MSERPDGQAALDEYLMPAIHAYVRANGDVARLLDKLSEALAKRDYTRVLRLCNLLGEVLAMERAKESQADDDRSLALLHMSSIIGGIRESVPLPTELTRKQPASRGLADALHHQVRNRERLTMLAAHLGVGTHAPGKLSLAIAEKYVRGFQAAKRGGRPLSQGSEYDLVSLVDGRARQLLEEKAARGERIYSNERGFGPACEAIAEGRGVSPNTIVREYRSAKATVASRVKKPD